MLGLFVLLVATVIITPRIGSIEHDPDDLERVIRDLRKPRLHLAMVAGAALAVAGMTFQALFRNPLATPFTLGISSGASLALALGLALGMSSTWLGGMGQTTLAFCGALCVVLVVFAVAQLRRESSTSTLLLAGVSINFICGAGIILIQYFLREEEAKAVIYWLIGSVDNSMVDRTELLGMHFPHNHRVLIAALVSLASLVPLVLIHRDLDLLMMGEQLAAGRGVNVKLSRALAYFCASLLSAAVVSVCGPIAFVGLLVPHTMRMLIGPAHRFLLPACVLFGMSLLPICDCIARNFMGWVAHDNYTELPVGVVTNVLGGIFFLVILVRQRADRPIVV